MSVHLEDPSSAARHEATVLVVEDNAMHRDILSRRLRLRGYDVLEALDGPDALRAVHAHTPDLIVMDLAIPKIDGCEVTRQLKTDEATCSIPVIALTAHNVSAQRERALGAGCDIFAIKPLDFELLLEHIVSLLER